MRGGRIQGAGGFWAAHVNVPDDKKLHVQFMSKKWDAGDPRQSSAVANDQLSAYDDHNYIFYGDTKGDQSAFMRSACTDSRVTAGEDFVITGEWSLTSGVDPDNADNADFFKKYFAAQ
ncbi:hypothetical protein DHEL01_v211796 [Diaporthe helianthi]|uniref:Uncharacterized protein n=1 Tax=Diaporthe helianthi TaxID=158607 RepID=A0A2P5HHT4_DIAHE|nr:hypothetical protein DHEL01_v211796 [Diaporthe helianthi]